MVTDLPWASWGGPATFYRFLDDLERDAASRRGNHGRHPDALALELNRMIAERPGDWRSL